MASTAVKWWVGCGIGCLVLILAVVGAMIAGGMYAKKQFEKFEQAVDSREELESAVGRIEDYTPPVDGRIPADRIERFLVVRQAGAEARAQLSRALESMNLDEAAARELEQKPFLEKMKSVWDLTGSAFGMVAEMGALFEARNRALIEQRMGMGEYTYLYVITYWSWLGGNPADGELQVGSKLARAERRGVQVDVDDPALATLAGDWPRSRYRRNLLTLLENQLAAIDASAQAAELADWRARLAAELQAMRDDPQRLPWADGLPPELLESLEPFRDRLAASYDARTNEYELMMNKRQGSMSIRAE